MNCPKCDNRLLTAVRAGGIEVDHCQDCGGIWLDQSELPRLLAVDPADVRELRRGRDRNRANAVRGDCPRCQKEMLRVSSALNKQVTVDSCPDCGGVWLDGGEFDKLLSGQ